MAVIIKLCVALCVWACAVAVMAAAFLLCTYGMEEISATACAIAWLAIVSAAPCAVHSACSWIDKRKDQADEQSEG